MLLLFMVRRRNRSRIYKKQKKMSVSLHVSQNYVTLVLTIMTEWARLRSGWLIKVFAFA